MLVFTLLFASICLSDQDYKQTNKIGDDSFVHGLMITTSALSPDGKMSVTASHDGNVKIWEIETGKELKRLGFEKKWVKMLAWTPDSKTLLMGLQEGTFALYEMSAKEIELFHSSHKAQITSISVSSDGKTILTSSDDMFLKIWDCKSRDEKSSIKLNARPTISILSGDEKHIITGNYDGTIRIFGVKSQEEVFNLKTGRSQISNVFVSKDLSKLISISFDRGARLWDLESRVMLKHQRVGFSTSKSVSQSSDEKYIAYIINDQHGSNIDILQVEKDKLTKIKTIRAGKLTLFNIFFSSDNKKIYGHLTTGILRIWDVESGKELTKERDYITHLALSASCKNVTALTSNGKLQTWDTEKCEKNKEFDWTGKCNIFSITASSDNKAIITHNFDRSLSIIDPETGIEKSKIDTQKSKRGLYLTSISSTDGKLVYGGDNTGIFYIFSSEEKERPLVQWKKVCPSGIICMDISSDGKHILAASTDGSIRVIELPKCDVTFEITKSIKILTSARFSHDAKKILATTFDNEIYVWDVAKFDKPTLLKNFKGNSSVTTAEFFDNSLIYGDINGNITIVDNYLDDSSKKEQVIKAHNGRISRITVLKDSIVTFGSDYCVKFWKKQ